MSTAAFSLLTDILRWRDNQIPPEFRQDPDSMRRARLINRFGTLGFIFGVVYTLLYVLIGHYWGAAVITLCTVGVALTPTLMLRYKSTQPAGHLFSLTLTFGFFSLCCCEGGLSGHAIAWLVSVPLCALLLLGRGASVIWLVVAFLAAAIIAGVAFAGIQMPRTYDPKWETLISAMGYLGLVLFMSMLGLIFESTRANAYANLQKALSELRDTNQLLVALNKEKTEFLGIAAHDLKNPLSAIMAGSEMMITFADPDMMLKLAENIHIASQRMHNLIKDLLDANAIEEGRKSSKVESCDLGPLVTQIVEQNRFNAEKKQIEIHYTPQDRFFVRTDRDATLQILDNLISNAVKYSPRNSNVHIHFMPEKDHSLVVVRDEGAGISDEDQTKLFQKYCRLTARPTGGESSTGLGLSIAKRLAISLGGDILCYSRVGLGSTFSLRLPVAPAEMLSDHEYEAAGSAHHHEPAYASYCH